MKLPWVLGVALTFALAANFAFADPTSKESKAPAEKAGVAQTGMKAYVDPETGQLTSRPATQADAAALDSAFQEDYSKIQEIHKADGSTEWVFNGQVDSAMVARRGADGQLQIECAEHGVIHDHLTMPVSQGARNDL